MRVDRRCEMCGNGLPGRGDRGGRPALYCSGVCRQRAFRRRAAVTTPDPAAESLPDPTAEPARRGRPGVERSGESGGSRGPADTRPARAPHGGDPARSRYAAEPPARTPATHPVRPLPGFAPPRPLDSFVGRRRELARLRTLVRTARLLTLTGPGGIGKTRLALEFAASCRGHTRLAELDSVASADELPRAIAASLGVGERGGRSCADALAHAIGEHRVLLVLDNCEHLAEACARLVALLLGRCPRLRVLATSREVLRVPGEVVFRLGELALEPAGPGLDADAVRLFRERAAERAPGPYDNDNDNTGNTDHTDAGTVAEICRRLDGLPLAIELAARRAGVLPPHEILTGLDDSLALLSDGSRSGPGRHRELSAAIDWSHRLLDRREQELFRRLSVLAGGFDADAAAAVHPPLPPSEDTGRPEEGRADVLRTLCALEAKSLVVRVAGEGGAAGPARFRQLSTIRAYGLARLTAAGESRATWLRAVDRLTGLVGSGAAQVFPDHSPGPATRERENLAAAVAYTTAHDGTPHPRLALELARIHFQQEQPTAARALLTGSGLLSPGSPYEGEALALAARLACQQRDAGAALRAAGRAVAVARADGDPALLTNALDARAAARVCGGAFTDAVTDFAACLDVVATLDRPADEAWCRHHLAWALLHTGAFAEADALMVRCLPVLLEQPLPCKASAALHTAGAIRLELGDPAGARDLFAQSLRRVPELSRHSLYPLEGLAVVAARQGATQRSLRLFSAASAARDRLDTESEDAWRLLVGTTAARAEATLLPAARERARAGGRRLRWPQLRTYALGEDPGPAEPSDSTGTAGDASGQRLTGRENAVALLIAEGLTNREIAGRLGISPSTVATHLNHIRDKLGIRSRTRIALWVTRGRTAPPAVF
ncbi:ATP-binding protein [Streptomyces yaizuensis]|uniref:LuxR C-terminal-related transcriptional regulator n=1 Tax=Streptomyces yaizuensis TaxID=2989713 RepID=A0ABQ5NTV9_9ACTN|nr:LuxR C-terminal-related transcriptional regulator [Streptomyces sp. YSPA8]GLF93805.1 LuxR C-terminal-related transcriptional regulator [Streptomyces sp. YSPA8]